MNRAHAPNKSGRAHLKGKAKLAAAGRVAGTVPEFCEGPPPPDRPVVVSWPPCPPARAPALPPPDDRSRTLAPAPTLSRVVPESRTVVEVRLRTVVRVETPSTATAGRRFLMTTALDGSR